MPESRGAAIVPPAFQERHGNVRTDDFPREGKVVSEKLLLQCLCVCGDDDTLSRGSGVEKCRDEIGERLPDSCRRFDDEVTGTRKRLGHGTCHLELLRPVFESRAGGKRPVGVEEARYSGEE